jgi:hypothetical protein
VQADAGDWSLVAGHWSLRTSESQPETRDQKPVTSSQHRLNSITSNICQSIFDIIINPFFVIRQRILSAADPATQTNGLSGPMYLKRRHALAALEKITILHLVSLT